MSSDYTIYHTTIIIGIYTIIAIIAAPIIALQIQKLSESWKEKRDRKLGIFKALMATRSSQLKTSFEHVRALNMIDVEFYDDKNILAIWNKYVSHLNKAGIDPKDSTAIQNWANERDDLFTDLLMAMGKRLNYEFSIDHLKRQTYVPRIHGDIVDKQQQLMDGALKIVSGERSVKVVISEEKKMKH